MSQFSLQDKIKCVTREIGMRERVYPGWVAGKRMSQQKADHEIACMKDVLATLIGLEATSTQSANSQQERT